MSKLWGTVGRRVMLAIVVVVVAVAVFQALYFPAAEVAELSRALDKKALSATRLMAYVAAPSIEFDDPKAAVDVMTGAARDEDFLGAVLLSEDGKKTLAGYKAERVPLDPPVTFALEPSLLDAQGVRRIVVPVVSNGGSKAVLAAAFSKDAIAEEAGRVRLTTEGISAAMALLGALLALAIGRSLNLRMGKLVAASEKVARRDLSHVDLPAELDDDIGRMTRAFRLMLESQRELVGQITHVGTRISAAATELAAAAAQQERGATEQSTAVTETKRTMESLLGSAREIAKAAQGVLQNAERGQNNSQVVAERIAALSRHTQRITEMLDVIRGIATKSDILALNAALEGTKAGEAGKGFSLVADQIQRLAENVMGAVKDIKELTSDIATATQSTVLATEESTKLASDSTRSARQITLITQQQESGTEQVAGAMELISGIARQAADGSKEAVSSSTELRRLTETLQSLIGSFVVVEGAAGNGHAGGNGAVNGQSSARTLVADERADGRGRA